MEDLQLARACAEFADDKKAENIRILDLRGLSPVTDYFVLCSAMSAPQLRAVRDHIEDEMKEKHRERPLYRDGSYDSQWMILDYGNVMVHILAPEKRDYYALEELWGDAPELALTEEAPVPEPRPKREKPVREKKPRKPAAKKVAKKAAKKAPAKKAAKKRN
jgi:ribosome-associated protein